MKNEITQEPEIPQPKKTQTVITKHPNGRTRVYTDHQSPVMTDQSFKDQCDVNLILKKYKTTGVITHLNRAKGTYLDLTNAPDYQTSLDTVIKAQDAFMTLPAEIRERFGNDPSRLITFLSDPKNNEEGIKLGLLEKHETQNTHEKTNEPNEQNKRAKNANVKTEEPKTPSET